MNPNDQPAPTPQPGQPIQPPAPAQEPHDPYGFIMNTEHKPKKNNLKVDTNSFVGRLLLVLGAATILIVGIIVASNLIGGSKENNSVLLTSLAAEQQEIVRVAELGLKDSADSTVLAFAQTTKLSVTTQQSRLVSYLGTRNVKLLPASLTSKLDKKTDAALLTAKTSNSFDEVFMSTLKKSLVEYSANIKSNYNLASGETSKLILKDSFNSTQALLK